jgi:hypothetical protein
MSPMFDSLASAHEYVGLLLEAIHETAAELDDAGKADDGASLPWPRRRDAYLLIAYKLEQLRVHLDASHRGLADLRALHRMLERQTAVA